MGEFTPSIEGHLNRAQILLALQEYVNSISLPKRAYALATALLDEGRLSSKSTNASLMQRIEVPTERTVQRAFVDLKDAGLGVRKPGANTTGVAGFLPPLWVWHYDVLGDFTQLSPCDIYIANDRGIVCKNTGEIIMDLTYSAGASSAQRGDYWQNLDSELTHMLTTEIMDKRLNCIKMRRLEEQRGSGRSRFWAIQERVFAGELANRGIIQADVIVRRWRTLPLHDLR